jgi:hypothetical protein
MVHTCFGALSFVNEPAANYLGLSQDHPLRFGAVADAPWDAHLTFLHPEDREHSRKQWAEHLRTGKARQDQFRVLSGSGQYRGFLAGRIHSETKTAIFSFGVVSTSISTTRNGLATPLMPQENGSLVPPNSLRSRNSLPQSHTRLFNLWRQWLRMRELP